MAPDSSLPLAGRYQLLESLGMGGMALVYRALDINLQREVAIKLLRDDLIHDPAFLDRFLQEARSAANLSHPNIVTIFDYGHHGEDYFIVMEYVPGTDLKTLIRRMQRLPVGQALDLMAQIAEGVGYAHRAGLVHCDLKPQNILVTADGRAKITDFGISRALAAIQPGERSEVVWGSPQYFAPEQAAGFAPSTASDVYSLGVILFEMLTGRLPFTSPDPERLAELHLHAPPPSPRSFNPDIPPALELIVLKVLSKEPAARYRTADQLARVLRTFQQSIAPAQSVAVSDGDLRGGDLPAAHLPIQSPLTPLARVDWLAVLLGLVAFLAIMGLIPLWLYACLLYPQCPLN